MKNIHLLQSLRNIPKQNGFILLFTIVVISVTVGISVSLLLSSTRQSQLGSIQSETQSAFAAADTGMECGLAKIYPDAATFSCGGVVRTDQLSDPLKEVYYFDFRNTVPVSVGVGWSVPNIPWTASSGGGESSACGVVVITADATWANLVTREIETGYMLEAYGYSICESDSASLMKPLLSDPNLVERKILVRIPVVVS